MLAQPLAEACELVQRHGRIRRSGAQKADAGNRRLGLRACRAERNHGKQQDMDDESWHHLADDRAEKRQEAGVKGQALDTDIATHGPFGRPSATARCGSRTHCLEGMT